MLRQELTVDREAVFEELEYEPHSKGQWLAHNSTARFRVANCGRRWGKSVWAGHEMTLKMFTPETVNWIVGPTYALGEKEFRIVHRDFKKLGLLKYCSIHNSVKTGDMRIYFKKLDSLLVVASADKPESLVGEGLDHVVMSEAARHKMATWEMYIRPALADKRGSADFPSTPQGFNWFKGIYDMGQDPSFDEYASWHFPTWANIAMFPGEFDDEELVNIRNQVTPMYWNQEYAALFTAYEGLIFQDFDPQVHVRHIPYQPQWENHLAFDFGFCVDKETEILTQRGWLKYNEVLEGDSTLTFNTKTKKSEWQIIERMNIFEPKRREMVLMEGSDHSSLTTPNHRWPILRQRCYEYEFTTTEDLVSGDKIPVTAKCSTLPTSKVFDNEFVELVAWFWTEGQIHDGGISIWQNPGEYSDRIENVLTSVYGKQLVQTRYGRNRAPAGWVKRPQHRDCNHYAVNLNGSVALLWAAPDKIVSVDFINALTEEQLELFLRISMFGDGFISNTGSWTITQSKKERLEPIQIICTLLGLSTTLKMRNNSYGTETHSLYISSTRTRISPVDAASQAKKKEHGKFSITRNYYDDVIWCPTTSNSTWLARRNGTIYFTGNTDPTVCLDIMINPVDQRVYVWREYQVVQKNIPEHALTIKNRENPEGYHYDTISADPKGADAISTLQFLLGSIQANSIGVSLGVEAIAQALKIRDDGLPGLFISNNCPRLIEQMQSIHAKPTTDGSLKLGGDDHGPDALRYFFNEHFVLGGGEGLADLYTGYLTTQEARTFFQYEGSLALNEQH